MDTEGRHDAGDSRAPARAGVRLGLRADTAGAQAERGRAARCVDDAKHGAAAGLPDHRRVAVALGLFALDRFVWDEATSAASSDATGASVEPAKPAAEGTRSSIAVLPF